MDTHFKVDVLDRDGKIVESYVNTQALYDSLQRRYSNLVEKRQKDLNKAYNKGFILGIVIMVSVSIIVSVITIFI